jgi:hypothetical protein
MPCAWHEKCLEFLWLGDCAASLESGGKTNMFGDTIEKRGAESERTRAIAAEKQLSIAAGLSRPEFIKSPARRP